MVRLKEPLDGYHQRRAEKHGWIYSVVRVTGPQLLRGADGGVDVKPFLYECKSLATGVVCTFRPECIEEAEDDPQLP
jgi:hypothetical protein